MKHHCTLIVGITLATLPLQAAEITKANNNNNLTLDATWVGAPPVTGSGDIAVWNSTDATTGSAALGANTAWQGIKVTDTTATQTISSGKILTLGASGINLSTAMASSNI